MVPLHRRRLAVAALVAAVACAAATCPRDARASGPPPPPRAHELYATASVVFVGRVEAVGKQSMDVRVLETLKGAPGPSEAGRVTVGPIFEEECAVRPESERTPIYRAGDRILVAAVPRDGTLRVVGHRYGRQDLGDDAAVARAVSFARELLRIVALPDANARRAATVATLLSEDPAYAEAADRFQIGQLGTPEQSRPHAAGLTAALRAPVPLARKVALRALRGVAAPEAWERIVELAADPDDGTADAAAAALAAYERDEAVTEVEKAASTPERRALLVHLASSPRPFAHQRLHQRIAGGAPADRLLAYQVLGTRIERVGATEEDVAVLLTFLRSDAAATFETWQLVDPPYATRSSVLARGLVEFVREATPSRGRRYVAYRVLNVWAAKRWTEVLALLREEEAAFVARLDEGEPRSELVEILHRIRSTSARAAVERAAASNPDEHTRKAARSALAAW